MGWVGGGGGVGAGGPGGSKAGHFPVESNRFVGSPQVLTRRESFPARSTGSHLRRLPEIRSARGATGRLPPPPPPAPPVFLPASRLRLARARTPRPFRLLFFVRKWARPALRARARWIGAGGPAQPSPAGGGKGFWGGGRGRRGFVTPRFDTVARPSEWRARMRKGRKGGGVKSRCQRGFGWTRVGRERAGPGCK